MQDDKPEHDDIEYKPIGALLVVGVLTIAILISWFGIYVIYLSRL